MSTARDRAEVDAAKYTARFMSDPEWVREESFIAGRTVTAEQIEQAARALGREDDARHGVYSTDEYRDIARVAFAAAGLIVEEEDA